jgi:hypothetical protein
MSHFMLFEDFKKKYEESITPEQFKSIKVGSTVKYGGFAYKVVDNDGFVLNVKDEHGRTAKLNLGMFNKKGAIV